MWRAPDVGDTPVLAVDVPSGVDGAHRQAGRRVLAADRTVTFAALKPGLLFAPGATWPVRSRWSTSGWTRVGPRPTSSRPTTSPRGGSPAPRTPQVARAVRIVAGSPGMTGAAAPRRGRRAARRRRDGDAVGPRRRGRRRRTRSSQRRAAGDRLVGAVLDELDRFQALVDRSGLGRERDTVAAVRGDVVAAPGADGGRRRRAVRPGLEHRRRATAAAPPAGADGADPHDGEYELLAGAAPGADRIAAARRLAADTGGVVLLKGPATVVADPDGDVLVVAAGDDRLATAGTGDVLAGIIGALLARGLPPFDAAAAGRVDARPRRRRSGPPSASSPATARRRPARCWTSCSMSDVTARRWAWAEIDLDAIAHNVGVLRDAVAPAARVGRRQGRRLRARRRAGRRAPRSPPGATGLCVALDAGGRRAARRRASTRRSWCSASSRPSTPRRSSRTGSTPTVYTVAGVDALAAAAAARSTCACTSRSTPACTASAPRPPTRRRSPRDRRARAGCGSPGCSPTSPSPTSRRPVHRAAARRVRRGARRRCRRGPRPLVVHAANSAGALAHPAPATSSCAPASRSTASRPGPAVDDLRRRAAARAVAAGRVSFVKRLRAGERRLLRAAPPARQPTPTSPPCRSGTPTASPRRCSQRRRGAGRRAAPADRRRRHDGPAHGRLRRRSASRSATRWC